ncbi:uncharacterized protein LOC143278666 [Babylonia areolata]|uniref:uncharacterized protein LOC143278666 n=1 Tax=Babylonia areolata TaxID=304850 RepID=UPI003FD1E6EB
MLCRHHRCVFSAQVAKVLRCLAATSGDEEKRVDGSLKTASHIVPAGFSGRLLLGMASREGRGGVETHVHRLTALPFPRGFRYRTLANNDHNPGKKGDNEKPGKERERDNC